MKRSQQGDGDEGVAEQEAGDEGLRLRRDMGLWSAMSLTAGAMIGSGIFMSLQGVLVYTGSPGASLMVWAVCGLLATLGALCYAELEALVPESGGKYTYILRTFGSLPTFLVIYTFVLVGRLVTIAAISLSVAKYVLVPFFLPRLLLATPGHAQGGGYHLHPAADVGQLLELADGRHADEHVHDCPSVLLAGYHGGRCRGAGPGPRPHGSPALCLPQHVPAARAHQHGLLPVPVVL